MIAKTNLYDKFQTVIPKEIRKKLGINKEYTIVEWSINKKGKVELEFRKKLTDKDMVGIIELEKKTNALELEKELYLNNE
jgi:bifunctional DNA-binding transcriptional regulator/antitoxin component of YhaV-PrlF toxin-antitoxin module